MPTYEVELSDGRKFHVDADGPPSEQDVMQALGSGASEPAPKEDQRSLGGDVRTAIGAARIAVPVVGPMVARVAANNPSVAQKVISAASSSALGTVGAGMGSVFGPAGSTAGAIIGASAGKGISPTQAAIREAAGKMAGETPAVARSAARAIGTINYAKAEGMKLKPADVVGTGDATPALDGYAASNGQRINRIIDQYGKVASGPEALPPVATAVKPGLLSRAGSVIGPLLSRLQGATAMTDIAQAAEPTRTDIGVMGIGKSQPTPTMEEAMRVNAVNQQKAEAAYRAALLAKLGQR